jgi:toxin FitB
MRPVPAVRHGLDEQAPETLHLCSVTVAESMFDIAALSEGKRRDLWTTALDGVLKLFADRIRPFDAEAARIRPSTHARLDEAKEASLPRGLRKA